MRKIFIYLFFLPSALLVLTSAAFNSTADGWKLQFSDDFERGDLGEWGILYGEWSIEKAWSPGEGRRLTGRGEVYLKRGFPGSVRIEYDAITEPDEQPCDLSATICSRLQIPDQKGKEGSSSGYWFGFGDHMNAGSMLKKEGKEINRYDGCIELGKVHHIICQRDGNKLTHMVDGKVLYECMDKKPLTDRDHEGITLYKYHCSKAQFDNVKVYTKP